MTAMPEHRWTWPARPVRVVDGDTVELEIDRGFRGTSREIVRLLGIDTPEVVGKHRAAGIEAMEFAWEWINEGSDRWPLVIETFRPKERDSFGRWLATIWRVSDGRSLNDDLLESGHAIPHS